MADPDTSRRFLRVVDHPTVTPPRQPQQELQQVLQQRRLKIGDPPADDQQAHSAPVPSRIRQHPFSSRATSPPAKPSGVPRLSVPQARVSQPVNDVGTKASMSARVPHHSQFTKVLPPPARHPTSISSSGSAYVPSACPPHSQPGTPCSGTPRHSASTITSPTNRLNHSLRSPRGSLTAVIADDTPQGPQRPASAAATVRPLTGKGAGAAAEGMRKTSIGKLYEEHNQLRNENAYLRSENEGLKQKLKQCSEESQTGQSQWAEENAQLRREYARLVERSENLERKQAELEQCRDRDRFKYDAQLQAAREVYVQNLAVAKMNIDSNAQTISDLNNHNAELEAQIAKLRKERKQGTPRLSPRTTCSTPSVLDQSSQSQLQQDLLLIQDFQEEASNLTRIFAAKASEAVQGKTAEIGASVEPLLAQLAQEKSKSDAKAAEVEELKARVRSLNECGQLQLHVDELKARLKSQDEEAKERERRRRERESAREDEMRRLAAEAESAKVEADAANEKAQAATEEANAYKTEILTTKAELDRAHEGSSRREEELAQLRLQVAAVQAAEAAARKSAEQAKAEAAEAAAARRSAEDAMANSEAAIAAAATHAGGGGSEARLRAVLNDRGASTKALEQAIFANEALTDEARRELNAKRLRAKRAAYERLHSALDRSTSTNEEAVLLEALEEARSAGVEAEDIALGEARLLELQSQTAEQREAKAAHELMRKRKEDAFRLVKKDDADSLRELLEGLGPEVRWQDWKDYSGRTLTRFASELQAGAAKEMLTELRMREKEQAAVAVARVEVEPESADAGTGSTGSFWGSGEVPLAKVCSSGGALLRPGCGSGPLPPPSIAVEDKVPLPPCRPAALSPARETSRNNATSAKERLSKAESPSAGIKATSPTAATTALTAPQAEVCPSEESELKAKAFRAVVQDDVGSLNGVLERLDRSTWSKWENKASKDLLTLSQERGSSGAYSVLAKALGMVQEMKRESFEEREAVWIFVPGEIQPLRATVLEDTPAEKDTVLVEYWDGDAPPTAVDRCIVRKMWS